MSTSDEQEEYEVEKIIEAVVHWKRGKKVYWKYLVKWKGYDVSENTWEEQAQFENAPLAVEEFWKSVDTDGRDWEDGSLFKVGEEFVAGSASWSPSRRKSHRKQEDEEEGVRPSQATSTSSQRRSTRKRAKQSEDEDEPRTRTKVKKEKTSISSDEEEPKPSARKRGRPRKSEARKAESEAEEEEEEPKPSARKRGRPRKEEKASISSDEDEEQEQPKSSPRKRGRPRKSEVRKAESEVEEEEEEEEPKPSPKKRGRPRKEEKTSISSDEEEQPKSSPRKRGRPRKSEVQKEREDEHVSSRRSARVKVDASDSEDDHPLRPRKKARSSPVKSSTKGKRKAYESDDSGSSPPRVVPVSKGKTVMSVDIPVRGPDTEPKAATEEVYSPGGSLFSGDEGDAEAEAEVNDSASRPVATEASAPMGPPSETVRNGRESSVLSAGDPNNMRRSMSLDRPNEKASSPSALPAHRQRAANPRVKLIEDPKLTLSLQDRLKGRRPSEVPITTQPSTPSTSVAVASSSSVQAPVPLREKKPLLAPSTLLTFEKGKLKSHRPKVMPAPPSQAPPPVTTSVVEEEPQPPIEQPETKEEPLADTGLDENAVLNGDSGEVEDQLPPNGLAADNIAEEINDDELFADIDLDGHFEPDTTGTGDDELLLQPLPPLRSLLNNEEGADLPDFEEGQLFTSIASTEDGEIRELREPEPSVPVAEASSSSMWQPTSLLAGSSRTTWKQSTIFGLATPPTTGGAPQFGFEPFEPTSGEPVVKPAKFSLSIPLDPSRNIPVVLKDVSPATYDTTSRLTDLLGGNTSGPPGKLYAPGVLELVKKGGTCARIDLVDETSTDHKNHFSQLRIELEAGKVFIVVLGTITVALFSSQNAGVGKMLLVPDNLLGISKTLIMSHIVVESAGDFVKFAMEATDLKLL